MTTDGHEEDDVRRAVVAAVAGLEAPDRGRLAAIEQRLLADARRRPASRPWWWVAVGAALAAGATAGYWGLYGGDAGGTEGPASGPEAPLETRAAPAATAGGDNARQGTESNERGRDRESPIIYQGQ